MRCLLDTNVLSRIAQPRHPQHSTATEAVDELHPRGDELFLVPQVLYELWVVCTRPLGENGLGLSAAEARGKHQEARALFAVLADNEKTLPLWEELVVRFDVKGKNAHDARLVAAMKVHGLTHILTFNTADFVRFPDITVLAPERVAQDAG
jgi:predicted nucleic acid-binding protein